ncbi:hypothetical protein L1049_009010 [Liquidambar formosana]|uniref:Transmembrane protein n=1 Tax=Liquidambar formosana TaxID=63359 RepID=A0AAP0S581_LIQFO
MAHFLLLCLIPFHAFVVLAMANEKVQTMVEPNVAPSPSNGERLDMAQAPVIRKLGKHYPKVVKSFGAPCSSPSQAPNVHSVEAISSSDQTAAVETKSDGYGIVQGQEVHLKVPHHHSMDKSVAGGGVILGGLATTFLVAVFCYIRATGRGNTDANNV